MDTEHLGKLNQKHSQQHEHQFKDNNTKACEQNHSHRVAHHYERTLHTPVEQGRSNSTNPPPPTLPDPQPRRPANPTQNLEAPVAVPGGVVCSSDVD